MGLSRPSTRSRSRPTPASRISRPTNYQGKGDIPVYGRFMDSLQSAGQQRAEAGLPLLATRDHLDARHHHLGARAKVRKIGIGVVLAQQPDGQIAELLRHGPE